MIRRVDPKVVTPILPPVPANVDTGPAPIRDEPPKVELVVVEPEMPAKEELKQVVNPSTPLQTGESLWIRGVLIKRDGDQYVISLQANKPGDSLTYRGGFAMIQIGNTPSVLMVAVPDSNADRNEPEAAGDEPPPLDETTAGSSTTEDPTDVGPS